MKYLFILFFSFLAIGSSAQDEVGWIGIPCKLQFIQRQLGRELPSREFKYKMEKLLPSFDSTKIFLPREVDKAVILKTDKKSYKKLLKFLKFKTRKRDKYSSGLKGCECYHDFFRKRFFINTKKKYLLIYFEVSASGKISIEKILPKMKTDELKKVEKILNSDFEIIPATMQNPSNLKYENVSSKEVFFIGNLF